jgi:prenylcysteine oxidase / farnesylcysteine lyase
MFIPQQVVGIQRPSEHFWTVITRDERRNYDAVILAAPYHSSHISLPDNLSSLIPPQPYIHLHVTLLTTTAATPNPEYFGYKPGASVPTTILTSSEGARQGGNASEFNSVTYHGHAKNDTQMSKEWIVKIFSMERISDEWLENMFQNQIGWVFRKEVCFMRLVSRCLMKMDQSGIHTLYCLQRTSSRLSNLTKVFFT